MFSEFINGQVEMICKNMENMEPIQGKIVAPKKKIKFVNEYHVHYVPNREEYMKSGDIEKIWFNEKELQTIKVDIQNEAESISKDKNVTIQRAYELVRLNY